jgi:uncharacterized DUF497 family protein
MNIIRRFYATEKAKRHFRQEHDVEWHEAEEVLLQNPPLRKTTPSAKGERRYYAVGRTDSGRLLCIILDREDAETVRVVTAYEPRGQKQRRRVKRRERR